MRAILVTGANGFIGRALCKHLVENGYEVRGGVRSMPAVPLPGVQYAVMPDPIDDMAVTSHANSLCDGVFAVVHLAGVAHGKGKGTEDAFYKGNVQLTELIAEQARVAGVERFIFVSSIGVNGASTSDSPFNEEAVPKPNGSYARSKLQAEEKVHSATRAGEMSAIIIRPTLVYGVDAPGNFRRLVRLAGSTLPLPFANAENQRSVISLSNLVSLLALVVEHPAAKGQLFLAADSSPVSTREMIEALRLGMGRKRRLFSVPLTVLGIASDFLSMRQLFSQLYGNLEVRVDKACELLGWAPDKDTLAQLEAAGRKTKNGLFNEANSS